MSEHLVPEARNRSRERSKTPFHLRSQCDGENCNEVGHVHVPTKKSPTVSTITEEPESPATKHKSAANNISMQKTIIVQSSKTTNSNNVASQMNSNQNSIQASLSSSNSNLTVPVTSTTITTKVQTKSNQSNQKTVLNSKRILNTRTEIKENILNKAQEDLISVKHSTPKQTTSSTTRVSPNILENVNLNEHLAYKEYKEAGEYWKKYPKTDYVYSTTYSPFRREIKPGVIAMPNMSRRSLEHHQDRINEMASNNPTQESFIRTRYQSSYEKFQNFNTSDNYVDSQDELDADEYNYRTTSLYEKREVKTSIVSRFLTTIITFMFTSWHKFCRIFSSETDYRTSRYSSANESKGFFSKIASSFQSIFLSIFRYIYLIIATIQFWDSCFLQSSSAGNRGKKRFLLLLLLLLPLLLLAAGLYANETDRAAATSLHVSLPIFLQSIKAIGYDLAESTKSVKSYFDFNWHLPFIFESHKSTINLPQSSLLTDQQYADLIKHIDSYIEHIVAQQSQSKHTTSPEANNILIASIVKENIINYKYQLTLDDIERIANAVRAKLSSEENESNVPTRKHREFIANVVKENVNLHLSEQKHIGGTDAEVKIDEILLKIFASPKFLEIIDQEILNQINSQLQHIGTLENKIKFVNDKLADKSMENQDITYSLNLLKNEHENLLGNINGYKNDVEIKLEKLLRDVDLKFATLNQNQHTTIDNHVKLILMDIMGYDNSKEKATNVDLKSWIQNIFVAKEYLEQRLNELSLQFDKDLKDELNRSAAILLRDVSEQIKSQTLLIIEQNNQKHKTAGNQVDGALDVLKIKGIVREVLAIYDADKTGLVDYALESAGGEVLSTRCTENYRAHYQLSIFGIPIPYNYQSNTPRTAISPTVQPGNCWSFQGFPGFLVLKLNTYVFVSGFTMEHIPKTLAPNGKIDSAPKNFTVWGLENENDHDPIEFGKYAFLENGTSLQYFSVENKDLNKSFNVVELRIESNHGNQNYTCLYRFRVHGQPDT